MAFQSVGIPPVQRAGVTLTPERVITMSENPLFQLGRLRSRIIFILVPLHRNIYVSPFNCQSRSHIRCSNIVKMRYKCFVFAGMALNQPSSESFSALIHLCMPGAVFSYKLRYIVGFWLVEMAISTNQKPTIYRNLYENTVPVLLTAGNDSVTVCDQPDDPDHPEMYI